MKTKALQGEEALKFCLDYLKKINKGSTGKNLLSPRFIKRVGLKAITGMNNSPFIVYSKDQNF
jgi:hypothetical protein